MHQEEHLILPLGSLAILPAKKSYVAVPEPHMETVAVHLDLAYLTDQLRWLPHTAPFLERLITAQQAELFPIHPRRRAALHQYLHELVYINDRPEAELRWMACLAAVVSLLQHVDPTDDEDGRFRPCRQEVMGAIRALVSAPERRWSAEQLASEVSLSPSQLRRLFIEHAGTTPFRYLRELRAQRMLDLLATGNFTVAEAAREVGWRDASHASRAFRSIYGHAPSTHLLKRADRGRTE